MPPLSLAEQIERGVGGDLVLGGVVLADVGDGDRDTLVSTLIL